MDDLQFRQACNWSYTKAWAIQMKISKIGQFLLQEYLTCLTFLETENKIYTKSSNYRHFPTRHFLMQKSGVLFSAKKHTKFFN